MPLLNSWMTITLRIPFLIGILVLVFFIGLMAFIVLTFLRKYRQVQSLRRMVEEQNNKIDSLTRGEPSVSVDKDTYLQFIYNVSHEVSNPLQSVQINLENMVDCAPEETGRRNQYYEIIKQEIKRLFTLTENLRLLSRLESIVEPVRREPVNVKSVIEDVIMAQFERASTGNVKLEYQAPNRPATVLGNRENLYQLIFNLVDNSIKYSKNSGGEIIIRLEEESGLMHIIVTDNGIGIPKEDLPFIFDTAYRSPETGSIRRAGSGLGLAIVKRIVSQHEGTVNVDSIVGKGTTITADLPIYNPTYRY